MAEYILTARSPAGQTVTERVDAPSADSAVLSLHERGYSEIVLHTDDVEALYTKQREVSDNISPADYIALRHVSGRWQMFLFLLPKTYAQSWKFQLLLLALLAARRWFELPWNWLDYLSVGALLLPAARAAISQLLLNTSAIYDKLLAAASWGRWQEVLDVLPSLRGQVPHEELEFRHAQALAGSGCLAEALQMVEPLADGTRMPQWLYWGRLADLYHAAGKPDQAIPCAERAAELAPDNATVLLDLALALLRNQRDLPRAKNLLEQCRAHALSDVLVALLKAGEGVAALEDGDNKRAKEFLSLGLEELSAFASANPMIGSLADSTYAYLAIAEARLGDREASRRHFQQAEPRLRALGCRDILNRCAAELRIGVQP